MNNKKKSYAIIGTGAIGGLYGARLQQAGHEVHFLLHSDYDHVCKYGISVKSVDGDIILPRVNAYADASDMPKCDVVMVSLKSTHNHLLADILPHVIKKDGIVLLMQNGLGEEETISTICPNACIIGGLAFICSNKVGPGSINHIDFGHVHIAEFNSQYMAAGITDNLKAVESDFIESGTKTEALGDLTYARWRKLVWNIPFNGLTVLLGATTDRLMANKSSAMIAEELMEEVVAGAAGFEREISRKFIDTMLDYTRKMKPYKPSMLLDYEHSKMMELEAIYSNPIQAAASRGVDMPTTKMLYRSLCFLQPL
jgi:2-dehydropantoate 2-reductase